MKVVRDPRACAHPEQLMVRQKDDAFPTDAALAVRAPVTHVIHGGPSRGIPRLNTTSGASLQVKATASKVSNPTAAAMWCRP